MTNPTHYVNFTPADAVQYDGTNADECAAFAKRRDGRQPRVFIGWSGRLEVSLGRGNTAVIKPGQWLVKQGDRVWVQDEEPARVESRIWAIADPQSPFFPEPNKFSTGTHLSRESAIAQRERVGLKGWVLVSQVESLSNGWTGPWTPVNDKETQS